MLGGPLFTSLLILAALIPVLLIAVLVKVARRSRRAGFVIAASLLSAWAGTCLGLRHAELRGRLLGRVLVNRFSVDVAHITADGQLRSQLDLLPEQTALF